MKQICLYFQIHQPFRFRKYRFFDIGNDHYYYDDYANETILQKIATNCYLPANKILLEQIKKHDGKFKVGFSISGIALEQFEIYAPQVIDSFKELAATGCVEFLSETYSHSLVALKDTELFAEQVKKHDDKIEALFGQRPTVFRNTELVYSDEIGEMVHNLGFTGMFTEGAKHILGWKSPGFIYCNAQNPRLKLAMRNYKLSDDISFRFANEGWSEYPLTTPKFLNWVNQIDEKEKVMNLWMDYETFGEHQKKETGILDFLEQLPSEILENSEHVFKTPSEIFEENQPVSSIHVPHPISWADEERDLSAWLGNHLQEEAFNKLYDLTDRMKRCTDAVMKQEWEYLQVSDHFYYMCTKYFSDGEVHQYFNPYESPYEAFMNYMNVLSDFTKRLEVFVPFDEQEKHVAQLKDIINKQNEKIEITKQELAKLRTKLSAFKDEDIAIKL